MASSLTPYETVLSKLDKRAQDAETLAAQAEAVAVEARRLAKRARLRVNNYKGFGPRDNTQNRKFDINSV